MLPVLALMMVEGARAASAKFTTKETLEAALNACLSDDISPVGNCCAQNSNPATIVLGTGGDQAGECADGYTHLQNWDVSEVDNMYRLFYYKQDFDQPLNSWDVSKVTNMGGMFYMNSAFNQPLNDWNVASVTIMDFMFFGASSYNQPPLCNPSWRDSFATKSRMFEGVKGGGSIDSSPCCPAGTYRDACTSVCTDCAAGKYNEQKGSDSEAYCKDCAAETYSPAGATNCAYSVASCPAGTYAESPAACTRCADNMDSLAGATECRYPVAWLLQELAAQHSC